MPFQLPRPLFVLASVLTAAGVVLAVAWDPLESTCRHASLSIL